MGFFFLVKLLKFKLTQLQKLKLQFRIRKTYSTLLLGFSLFEDFSKIEAIRVKPTQLSAMFILWAVAKHIRTIYIILLLLFQKER